VPHKKHITSPLRAQQVNAIYSFVMININITILDIIHCLVSYLKQRFGDWILSSSSVTYSGGTMDNVQNYDSYMEIMKLETFIKHRV
jgi:hypothetical protein